MREMVPRLSITSENGVLEVSASARPAARRLLGAPVTAGSPGGGARAPRRARRAVAGDGRASLRAPRAEGAGCEDHERARGIRLVHGESAPRPEQHRAPIRGAWSGASARVRAPHRAAPRGHEAVRPLAARAARAACCAARACAKRLRASMATASTYGSVVAASA
jgi:hypothetical protein